MNERQKQGSSRRVRETEKREDGLGESCARKVDVTSFPRVTEQIFPFISFLFSFYHSCLPLSHFSVDPVVVFVVDDVRSTSRDGEIIPSHLHLTISWLQRAVCGVTGHSVFWSKEVKKGERSVSAPLARSCFHSLYIFLSLLTFLPSTYLGEGEEEGRDLTEVSERQEKRPKRDWIWRRRFQSLFNEFSFFPLPVLHLSFLTLRLSCSFPSFVFTRTQLTNRTSFLHLLFYRLFFCSPSDSFFILLFFLLTRYFSNRQMMANDWLTDCLCEDFLFRKWRRCKKNGSYLSVIGGTGPMRSVVT